MIAKETRKGGVNPLLDAPSWTMATIAKDDADKRPAWMRDPKLLPKRPPVGVGKP